MFQHSAPTLLAYGGTCANVNDVPIENILSFAFPFGIGGPKMKRRTRVSLELCIQLYLRLSLKQFMEGPTILVLNHMYNRQMSYMSSVMTCRFTVNRVVLVTAQRKTLHFMDGASLNLRKYSLAPSLRFSFSS